MPEGWPCWRCWPWWRSGTAFPRGLVEPPSIEALRARMEPAPPANRPPASFYSMNPSERLTAAWSYADQGDFGTALGAVREFLGADAGGAEAKEALYLRASLQVRHLGCPWRAVVDLSRYLEGRPEDGRANAARMLLAETHLEPRRIEKATAELHRVAGAGAGEFGSDAEAMLQGLGAGPGGGRGGAAGRLPGWLDALLPNSLGSLGLSASWRPSCR